MSRRAMLLRSSVVLWSLGAVAVVALTCIAMIEPTFVVVFGGGVVAVVAVIRVPHWALAAGLLLSLVSGVSSELATAGGWLLILCGLFGLFELMRSGSDANLARALVLPLSLIGWLILRFLVVGDSASVADALRCGAVVLAMAACISRKVDITRALGYVGAIFITASLVFGATNTLGTRFEGISGNPNRMVLGLLLLVPFTVSLASKGHHWFVRLGSLASVVAAIFLVVQSGSAQGLVGLLFLALSFFVWFLAGRGRVLRALVWIIAVVTVLVSIPIVFEMIQSSDDLTTLSGRTPIYAAALADIINNPLIGSGLRSVSEGAIVDRSAHSAVLGLAASAGILAAVVWITLMVVVAVRGAASLASGWIVGASAIILVSEQFVQSIELVPIAWAILAYFVLGVKDGLTSPQTECEFVGRERAANA